MELKELARLYLDDVLLEKSEGTFKMYRNHLNYCISYFETQNITTTTELNKQCICEFILYQRKNGCKNSTINKRIGVIRRALARSELLSDEITSLKKLKEDEVRFERLYDADLEILFNYFSSCEMKMENKTYILLMLDTGIRLSEFMNIHIEDINFTKRIVLLRHTKNKKERYVPFGEDTKILLKKIIGSRKRGKLYFGTTSSVGSIFERVKKACGFKSFHPHMLRHTFASRMVEAGMGILWLQNILGHESPEMTAHYYHNNENKMLEEYDRCNKNINVMHITI